MPPIYNNNRSETLLANISAPPQYGHGLQPVRRPIIEKRPRTTSLLTENTIHLVGFILDRIASSPPDDDRLIRYRIPPCKPTKLSDCPIARSGNYSSNRFNTELTKWRKDFLRKYRFRKPVVGAQPMAGRWLLAVSLGFCQFSDSGCCPSDLLFYLWIIRVYGGCAGARPYLIYGERNAGSFANEVI